MSNYIEYAKHRSYTPAHYFREFRRDFPSAELEKSACLASGAERAALIALPFMSMIRPIGFALSIGMGSCRCITHFSCAVQAGCNHEWLACMKAMGQTTLAVMSLAFSILHFNLGLMATTACDLSASTKRLAELLKEKKYNAAAEEALQIISSGFYLAMMLTGSLEFILLSTLVNMVLLAYQAKNEWRSGRIPEALAKIALGAARTHQAHGYFKMIERKRDLLAFQKYRATFARIAKGRDASHLLDSPLIHLKEKVDLGRVVYPHGQGAEIDFGSYLHGYGAAAVKGANLCFRTRVIEGKEVIELDFKLNHVHSARLHALIHELKGMNSRELHDLLNLSLSHASGIHIEETLFQAGYLVKGPAMSIKLEGLGSMLVGSKEGLPNLYDRVIVRFDSSHSIFEWHELLAFLDLEDALRASTQEDLERLKIGHLYRIFCPREATLFERTEEFFTLSLPNLKKIIIAKSPAMEEFFDRFLDQMQARELFPGKIRYSVPGLADLLRAHGARELTAAIMCSEEKTCDILAMILQMGLLSTETRFTNGIGMHGLSSNHDFNYGSVDSVFTQILTERHGNPDDLGYSGSIRLLFSLEALESGTYQSMDDSFGSRLVKHPHYLERPGIVEFIDQFEASSGARGHEIMIKERIDPSYIKGILVAEERIRKQLVDFMRTKELIERDTTGRETLFGRVLDEFIRVRPERVA